MTLITFIHPLPANHEEISPSIPGTACSFCFGYAFKNLIDPCVQRHHCISNASPPAGSFHAWTPARLRALVSDPPRLQTNACRLRMVAGQIRARRASQWSPSVQDDEAEPLDERVHDQLPVADMERLTTRCERKASRSPIPSRPSITGKFVHIRPEGNKIEPWEPKRPRVRTNGRPDGSPTTK